MENASSHRTRFDAASLFGRADRDRLERVASGSDPSSAVAAVPPLASPDSLSEFEPRDTALLDGLFSSDFHASPPAAAEDIDFGPPTDDAANAAQAAPVPSGSLSRGGGGAPTGSADDASGQLSAAAEPSADGADPVSFSTNTLSGEFNTPPFAEDDGYFIDHDTTIIESAPGVLGNDWDDDFDPLTAVLDVGPANAAVFQFNSDGSFTYEPPANWSGYDQFTYYAYDGTDLSDFPATVGIDVWNNAPWAEDDFYTAVYQTPLEVAAPAGVLSNDTDDDGDYPLIAEHDPAVNTPPMHGTLALNADGSFTYTPEAGYVGGDWFTYFAKDGVTGDYAGVTEATVDIDVVRPLADIDVDSNNDDWIDPEDDVALGGTDDPIEEELPGALIGLNDNDDNGNLTHDLDEFPFLDSLGNPANDDLTAVHLEIDELYAPMGSLPDLTDFTVALTATGGVKLWDSQSKQTHYSNWVFAYNDLPEWVYAEGYTVGEATLTLALLNPAGGQVSADDAKMGVGNVDVDIDSDNTGVLDGSKAEDEVEGAVPGKVLALNDDDDDGNGSPDLSDPGPFAVADDELKPVKLKYSIAGAATGAYYKIKITYDTNDFKLWKTQKKEGFIASGTEYQIGTDTVPQMFFVEGKALGNGAIKAVLSYHDPALTVNKQVDEDHVVASVIDPDLIAYRPQTEGLLYGKPFGKHLVPYWDEEDPGAGVRRNGDHDNGNAQVEDRSITNTAIPGENDLIEVDIVAPALPGLRYVLWRTNDNINVWDTPDKTDPKLLNNNTYDPLNCAGGACDVWVEWVEMDPAQKSADLFLEVRTETSDPRTNDKPVDRDKIHFYPFTSVVIVFGGHDQEPDDTDGDGSIGDITEADDPTNREGIFDVAQELYENGWDVHAYDEGAPGVDNGDIPYAEVTSAYDNRGVVDAALLGYSQGGGLVYDVAERLHPNYNVDF
ncbi:MAG: Ig-like domain-containing protein, partial [Planctomycetaceae bacterium]